MNPRKLQHQQAQDQTTTQHTAAQNAALEFPTAEEAIRHDAAQTELPPAIAERLKKSVEQEPRPPEAPWWKRILGG